MGLFSKKELCPVCGGEVKGFFYLSHDDLHDEENPVVFSFDQLTG